MGLTQAGCVLLLLYHLQSALCCLAPSPPPPPPAATTPPTPPPTSPPAPSPTSPPPAGVTEEESVDEFCAAYTSCVTSKIQATSACSSEPAEQCRAEEGYCGDPARCPSGGVKHGLCPEGNDNKCCTAFPFQEELCTDQGGTCMDK